MASMRSKKPEEVTFLIEGREIPIISASISRSIDTMADGWTCDLQWIPGRDKQLDARIGPYTYAKVQIYIGQRLVNTGRLYAVKNQFNERGLTKHLECWSYTADLVDSMITPLSQYEWQATDLYGIAQKECQQFGIDVGISQIVTGARYSRLTEPFDVVQAGMTETYSDLFTKLAYQRGAMCTNDLYGMLLLTMGALTGPIAATLGEQDIRAYQESIGGSSAKSEGWAAGFDGRKRFATYAVYGQSGNPEESSNLGILSEATDSRVPQGRRTNIIVSDVTAGNANVTAAWHRSRQLVQALTIPFPVIGYYTPAGGLWNPNDLVIVQAPSLDINIATKFLVRQIDYEYTTGGETAKLYLVPPEVYTGEPVREPWSGLWQ
jgi:prophage tail gpP-like protein